MAETRPDILMVRGRATLDPSAETGQGELKLSGALADRLGHSVRARALRVGGGVRLDAGIARDAPPGRHKAVLVLDGKESPVTIDVAERRKLRFRPGTVQITGRPGGKASAEVVVQNLGNVAVDVPAGGVSGLFASDGVAGAFASAYGVDSDDHQEIFGAFVLGLRQGFLGLMKLTLKGAKGEGPLDPGEVRALTAEFQLPKGGSNSQTGAGRRFHTTYSFDGGRLGVRLTLDAPAKRAAGKGAGS
jgi:hypothetical protein